VSIIFCVPLTIPPRSAIVPDAMAELSATTRRRPPRKGDLTERRLLAEAEARLADRPLSSIGIDELARAAGISRSAFYFYFASREALLRALGERAHDEVFASADVWLNRAAEPPADSIARALRDNLGLWRRHGPVLRALYDARNGDAETEALWRAIARRYLEATTTQIERGRNAGLCPPAPPGAPQLAAILTGMNLRAFYDASRSSPSERRDEELVHALATVWLRSVYGL
jgi:TetR/AcrR family transcriptional regulator, ethionamide resistance regulator